MSEKYIDLLAPIIESEDIGSSVHYGVKLALKWLDRHPDQVPGRTITESELDGKRRLYGEGWSTGFLQAGGEIIPDPEPTNAEKLASHVLRITDDLYIGLPQNEIDKIAESLDEAGVKAPGGDE